MKSIDELKGPTRRPKKAPKRTETAAGTQTHRGIKNRSGVPVMPRKGHDYAYELEALYDIFNL